jgi:glutathione S-transferase
MTLYSGPLSMFGAKAQIAALEKGLDFTLVMVPFEMQRLYHPKHPEVVRVNPKQQVPVLIHGEVEIFDSTQIFEYFEHCQPQPPLWPADPADRARARLLELKSDEVYFPPVIRLMSLQETPAPWRSRRVTRRQDTTTRWKRRCAIANFSPVRIPMPTSHSTWRSCSARAWAHR